ncbi:MAG: hypothetical protein Q9160_005042 [Pyrenula sp. 1 TL-2023]
MLPGTKTCVEKHEELPPMYTNSGPEHFTPPPGPPPGRKDQKQASDAAPIGSYPEPPSDNPPPYHDWTVVPDTALLPPPPSIRHDFSTTGNAPRELADQAHEWCDARPLFTPSRPHEHLYNSVQRGGIDIVKPPEFSGDISKVKEGKWKGRSKIASTDSIILSQLPLYFAAQDSPMYTERPRTAYFEVKILQIGQTRDGDQAALALGFCAQPYPSWRLPGWERGSLGVHGDDGRRYVNDSWGGQDFTSPFKAGETVGIGITFTIPQAKTDSLKSASSVFFTRNGQRVGVWDLNEQLDAVSGDVEGLEGDYDLYAGIGTFGQVEFEAAFAPERWLYHHGKDQE